MSGNVDTDEKQQQVTQKPALFGYIIRNGSGGMGQGNGNISSGRDKRQREAASQKLVGKRRKVRKCQPGRIGGIKAAGRNEVFGLGQGSGIGIGDDKAKFEGEEGENNRRRRDGDGRGFWGGGEIEAGGQAGLAGVGIGKAGGEEERLVGGSR